MKNDSRSGMGHLTMPGASRAELLRAAADFAAIEFEQRTVAVANGLSRLSWASPGERVSWSEVRAFADLNGARDRADFQPLYERALRRRELLGVLRGRRSAKDWLDARTNDKRYQALDHS